MAITVGGFSVKNPVFVNIVMVAILVIGFFSFLQLPREQFPEIPFYWVIITVPYPGVSAEDIEKNITSEIENELDRYQMSNRLSPPPVRVWLIFVWNSRRVSLSRSLSDFISDTYRIRKSRIASRGSRADN